jgi:cysteine sulfinate desulfinase/cysteine desulfurase-like protein
VVEAMRPYLADWFGNPSSDHAYAAEPKAALHRARTQVAELIGADTGEIVVTGPGSEANNLALRGAVALRLSIGRWTTADDIDRAAEALVTAAREGLA